MGVFDGLKADILLGEDLEEMDYLLDLEKLKCRRKSYLNW